MLKVILKKAVIQPFLIFMLAIGISAIIYGIIYLDFASHNI